MLDCMLFKHFFPGGTSVTDLQVCLVLPAVLDAAVYIRRSNAVKQCPVYRFVKSEVPEYADMSRVHRRLVQNEDRRVDQIQSCRSSSDPNS
jgi:hypothetical protein